ncbi:MAG: OmpA family protein [Mucilaginibacter sp.]
MKFIKSLIIPAFVLFALVTLQACKAKKLVQKPAAPVQAQVKPVEQPKPKPVEQPKAAVAVVKAPELDVNTVKIQFEFNSGVLKTDAYETLDKVAAVMKLHPSAKFFLNGYASEEGTKKHNMALSADRANAVKSYLVNAGVSTANLEAKGYGTSDPIGDNSTEAGKILNRRVEIRKQN